MRNNVRSFSPEIQSPFTTSQSISTRWATPPPSILALWQAALRPECIAGWERDLDIYLAHEQIKSAIVDTVRYSQAFIDPSYAPEPEHVLVDKLTVKLNNAYRRWSLTDRVHAAHCRSKAPRLG